MTMNLTPTFKNPTFRERIGGMLGVDFYRLFHTPLFYIMLAISAIIPAMILSMTGMDGGEGLYTNTWNIVAANTPLYIVRDIGDYANMNMVFIFGGILVSIFIGHDYRSGYVKQLFTTHAKKRDYMMSKSLVCAFAMACMCLAYLIAGAFAGVLAGTSFEVNAGSLLAAVLGKMLMSLGWASLYTFLNILFRRHFGISIALSFFIGTGIPVIGAAGVLGNNAILNIFLYGSSVNACLSGNLVTLCTCALVSAVWAVLYNLLGAAVLSRSDVY
ncbi:MAG: ABC transporter permease [Clostridia bacterium]|nr:ABC transporter permease [Clostridia bacterium]